jgi:hypothetical protein
MTNTRALTLLLTLTLAACNKNQSSMDTVPPPPGHNNTNAALATDAQQRLQELQARAAHYASNARHMPARDEPENRRLTAEQFALLSQMIPVLSGPEMTGDLQQQQRIIDSTRTQLAGGSMELAAEPTVSTGLRAAHRALSSLNQQSFAEVPEIGAALAAMSNSVNQLDRVTGPQHRLVAAQAFTQSSQAIQKIIDTMTQRLGNQINRPAETPTPPPAKSDEKGPTAT